ncbi:MAG: DUF4386 family protein [Anaerolineae bacterium]|nr:DUF4386 family protein [Anaerolineae bacterium]
MSDWKKLYTIGGIAALMTVLVGLVETSITFLPAGTSADTITVVDWFTLFQTNRFMALRNLGLLNLLFNAFAIPGYLGLYAALRKENHAYAALAMTIAFVGVAVFFATNRALPMLDLSNQYAAATTDTQRASLVAAGQTMLSVGRSHTPGTFTGFFFADLAGIIMSAAMLRSNIFGRASAYLGILGFALLMIFEILASFVWTPDNMAIALALFGGLLSTIWYVLSGITLFRLGNIASSEVEKGN